MFLSNIIVYGDILIPNGFKEVEYGECGGSWIPDTYVLLEDVTNVEWVDGSFLIVCSEGVYNKYYYSKGVDY